MNESASYRNPYWLRKSRLRCLPHLYVCLRCSTWMVSEVEIKSTFIRGFVATAPGTPCYAMGQRQSYGRGGDQALRTAKSGKAGRPGSSDGNGRNRRFGRVDPGSGAKAPPAWRRSCFG